MASDTPCFVTVSLQSWPPSPHGLVRWVFIFLLFDVEAETPILWTPDAKNWLIGKDSDAGKDWRREKGTTEDEMVGWHHQPSTWVWVDSKNWWWTGSLACCSPWGRKVSDMTEQLNWPELNFLYYTRTVLIGFKTHLDNPGWSQFVYICRDPFPSKMLFPIGSWY